MKPCYVELPLRVKTYDIDFVGHVNNIVYIRWLEDLRLKLLDAYYPLETLLAEGVAPVVVTTNIYYRQAIFLEDRLVKGSMWIENLERATFHLAAEFHVGHDRRATATQRGTFLNRQTSRPVRVPQGFRERFDATAE